MQVQTEYLCGWFISHFNGVINGIELIIHRIENLVQIMPFKTWKQIVCISNVSLLPSEVRLPLEGVLTAPSRLADYFAFPRGTCVMFALGFINLYIFFNLTWIPLENVSCLPNASWLTVHIQPNYLESSTETDSYKLGETTNFYTLGLF